MIGRWRRRAIFGAGRQRPPRGQALILFALVLPVLVLITAVIIEAGHLYFARRHLQSIADAAAIAGAQKASFDIDDPYIVDDGNLVDNDDGEEQAIANAIANGAVAGSPHFETATVGVTTVTGMHSGEVHAWVPPVTAPYSGYPRPNAHIEVTVDRAVEHWVMYLFGMPSTTMQVRAVARGYMPNIGSPALLALDAGNETAIVFDGSVPGFKIEGDVVSYGGIKANGNNENFVIEGQAVAYGSDAPGVNATEGSYGLDTGATYFSIEDPLDLCLDTGECTMPTWPTSNSCVAVEKSGVAQPPRCGDAVTVNTDEVVYIDPGRYTTIDVNNNGKAVFKPGQFVIADKLTVGSQATASGNGVEIMFTGACWVIDITGGAALDFSKPAGSTFMNIVFYVPFGSVDLSGTASPSGPFEGSRKINGSIYAPGYTDGEIAPWIPEANSSGDSPYGNKVCSPSPENGTVEISGDADNSDTIVNGQVIANTIRFNGNAPMVSWIDGRERVLFGVVLVNTP